MKSMIMAAASIVAVSAIKETPLVRGGVLTPNGKWIPEHYSTEDDDQLMKNLIEQGLAFTKDKGFSDKYPFLAKKGCGCSVESCTCCLLKSPTHYWIDRKGAFDAAKEIVGVNLHLEGKKLDAYLADNFD